MASLKKSGVRKKKRPMLELLLPSLVHEKCVSSSALWTKGLTGAAAVMGNLMYGAELT